MRSFIIFAFCLAMVLAMVESIPVNTIEEGAEDLQISEDFKAECKLKMITYERFVKIKLSFLL